MQDLITLLIGSIIFIAILLLYIHFNPKEYLSQPAPPVNPAVSDNPLVGTAKTWYQLSPDEQLNYLVTKYFRYETGDVNPQVEAQTAADNQYIQSLPQSQNCNDDYTDCQNWASNGECDVNPEFMLYNCQQSCSSCALTPQQRADVSRILNKRYPPTCAYHGAPYPGPLPQMLKVLDYGV